MWSIVYHLIDGISLFRSIYLSAYQRTSNVIDKYDVNNELWELGTLVYERWGEIVADSVFAKNVRGVPVI